MPFASNDDVRIYYKVDGVETRPWLVLLNSIGTDMGMWDACMPGLLTAFRVLRMDMRGSGASDAPGGDYSLAELAGDVVAAMDAAGVERAFVAGVSLGGMVAMTLALDHPRRVNALGLLCTSASMDRDMWVERIRSVRETGMADIAASATERLLSPHFRAERPDMAASLKEALIAHSPAGYASACAAIRDMDLGERIANIAVPALVVTGDADIATPLEPHGRLLLDRLPDVAHKVLACGHLPPVETPGAVVSALRGFFLCEASTDDAAHALFEEGLIHRRRVLGDEWVDASLANRTPFNADFQELITRIAWREIWGRPGLDERTRRLLVVAITASMGRWEEFELHVRSGLARGGFTREELKEVLMQTAIYAGVPAANTAFAIAGSILDERAAEADNR